MLESVSGGWTFYKVVEEIASFGREANVLAPPGTNALLDPFMAPLPTALTTVHCDVGEKDNVLEYHVIGYAQNGLTEMAITFREM